MQINSTHFFTNAEENTLLNKIQGIFEHRNIHFFDALVGYFRSSGYFRIREFIDKSEKIRILVGIDVDSLTAQYAAKGSEIKFIADDVRDDFLKKAEADIQSSKYRKEIEDGIRQFLADLASGKLEIKAHPSKKIHAKVYIFREEKKHNHGYGFVITGSSNLTEPGLETNFEFNVELRSDVDVEFALNTFEDLWKEAIDILPVSANDLKAKTYLRDDFTPYEIYIKFLIEYFGKTVEYDPSSVTDLPKGFKKLAYQIDAVNEGFAMLQQHHGFFLSDVVGLGKTVVGVLIARKFFYANGFRTKTLIICPPAVKTNWEETADAIGLVNYEIETNGRIHKINKPQNYDLIIVDEAHKFRTDNTGGYDALQRLCKTPCRNLGNIITEEDRSKRIILISATPLNNRPEDIRNLVYLFQDAKNSTLSAATNIQHFFAPLIEQYRKIKKLSDMEEVKTQVKDLYEQVRRHIIEPLTIRRTRTDIDNSDMYREDARSQGIVFPKTLPPHPIFYLLESKLEKLYDETIVKLVSDTEGLSYARYQALKFLVEAKGKRFAKREMISEQLAKIMKTLLIKRLDSSFEAFRASLRNFQNANRAMLKMFSDGKIYIVPDLKGKVSEYIMDDREDELEALVLEMMDDGKDAMICEPEDFEPGFIDKLWNDQRILEELIADWDNVVEDPKLDKFLEYLRKDLLTKNREGKLVVFSEAAVTTNYLKDKLSAYPEFKVLSVSSKNRKDMMPLVRANFDANYKGEKANDYNIVISTEVLAEGVNLHRANAIVNYDTPWNSTRLMQRIGRVNRVGTEATQIHIFNFYPTSKVEKDIELEKRAFMKLQAFHSALGEDSQIYSTLEDITTFGLFNENMEDEKDRRLEYLMELRDFKAQHEAEFKRIKNMPLRARVGREKEDLNGSTVTFIKTGRRDSFFHINVGGQLDTLSFIEAADIFKAKVEEKAKPLHGHHHDHIELAVQQFDEEVRSQIVAKKAVDITLSPGEQQAIAYLNRFIPAGFLSEAEREELKWAREAIKIGVFSNLPREINQFKKLTTPGKTKKGAGLEDIAKPVGAAEKLLNIIRKFSKHAKAEEPDEMPEPVAHKRIEPEIIISESFV